MDRPLNPWGQAVGTEKAKRSQKNDPAGDQEIEQRLFK
jgi:hypothetical protein